jgi:hypothetical protein
MTGCALFGQYEKKILKMPFQKARAERLLYNTQYIYTYYNIYDVRTADDDEKPFIEDHETLQSTYRFFVLCFWPQTTGTTGIY